MDLDREVGSGRDFEDRDEALWNRWAEPSTRANDV